MAQVERGRFLAVDLRRLPALAEIGAVAAQADELYLRSHVAQHARDVEAHVVGDEVAFLGPVEHDVECVGACFEQNG